MEPEKISTKGMSKTDWLKMRQRGIGGSDVPPIMGLVKWKSPLEVYEEKVASEPIIIPENSRMKAGRRVEKVVAEWWAEEHDFELIDEECMYFHGEFPYLLADIDRLIIGSKDLGNGVFEAKFGTSYARGTWSEDSCPEWVYWQLMHYIDVLGLNWGIAAGLIDGEFFSVMVNRDDNQIEYKNKILSNFWLTHVEAGVKPDAQTPEDIERLYPETVSGKQVDLDAENFDKYRELVESQEEKKRWAGLEDKLKFELKKLTADAEILSFKDTPLASFRYNKDSWTFDVSKFKAKHPDIYESFCYWKKGARTFKILKEGKELIKKGE